MIEPAAQKNGAEEPWEQRRGEMRGLGWVGTLEIEGEMGHGVGQGAQARSSSPGIASGIFECCAAAYFVTSSGERALCKKKKKSLFNSLLHRNEV